jgi:hypothetical protein
MRKNWIAKAGALLGVAMMALLAVNCGSSGGGDNNGGGGGGGGGNTLNVAGSWTGTWLGTLNGGGGPINGAWAVNFTQNGTQLSGTIKITGQDVDPGCANGSITGSISGSTITFGSIFGAACENINWNGTVSADGKSMSGNWLASDSSGTFTGTKQ